MTFFRALPLLIVCFLTNPALGQTSDPTEQARVLFAAGSTAYDAGEYRAAAQAFEGAYDIAKRPGILFSLGQTYRQLFLESKQRAEGLKSVEFYRRYLDSGDKRRPTDAREAIMQLERDLPPADAAGAVPASVAEAPKVSRLLLSSVVEGAQVVVDGEASVTLPLLTEIEPGPHELTVSARGYQVVKRRLNVLKGAVVALDIELEPLPGFITVTTGAGTEVWVDGRLIGRAPIAEPIEVKEGQHEVVLRKKGHRIRGATLAVTRGQTVRVEHKLQMTLARMASWGALGVGVAGGATAGVLGGLALSAQRKAEDSAPGANGVPVGPDARDEYNQQLETRNNLRAATFVVGGVAAASLVTAASLYLFDTPAPPREGARTLALLPLVGPGISGLHLTGSF